uniref:Uncharacterized protein n=1 Tax=Dunaliella tertiolecta TaxID=3047 RepID=A0A7S3QLX4_DUNTE|mmetsp:Transcript_23363/g.64572  ORF Transcript_23363/g.64572 Transcript_23363/m.64572 type:complete len:504 (+) Transcript_23363:52-1563(+)
MQAGFGSPCLFGAPAPLHLTPGLLPPKHLLLSPPSHAYGLPGFMKPSVSTRSVAQQRQPADPKANEDPLDNVLARLHRLNKKQRTTQKGFAPKPQSGPASKPRHDTRPKNRGKSRSTPASSSSSTAPASISSVEAPSSSPTATTSSPESPGDTWYVPLRSLTPEKPGPNQESIDAAIEAVMAKLNLERPSQRRARAAAATPSPQQEQPKQEPAHTTKERSAHSKKDSSSQASRSTSAAVPRAPKKSKKGGKGGSSENERDDLLFDEINLTKDERNQLFNRVFQSVSGLEDLEDDSSDDDEEPREGGAAQRSSSSKAAGSKGPKGFGLPPSAKTSADAPSSSTAATSGEGPGASRPSFPSDNSVPRLPVFLYCAEVAKTNDAILQLGLEQHVEVVDDLKQAQAVLSVKIGRGGRLNNLQQGKRTASNLGIPFVCVGRRMTQETLLPAIAQLVLDHRAKHGRGVGPEGSNQDELTRVLLTAAEAARKQVQLQPGWAQQMVADLGM